MTASEKSMESVTREKQMNETPIATRNNAVRISVQGGRVDIDMADCGVNLPLPPDGETRTVSIEGLMHEDEGDTLTIYAISDLSVDHQRGEDAEDYLVTTIDDGYGNTLVLDLDLMDAERLSTALVKAAERCRAEAGMDTAEDDTACSAEFCFGDQPAEIADTPETDPPSSIRIMPRVPHEAGENEDAGKEFTMTVVDSSGERHRIDLDMDGLYFLYAEARNALESLGPSSTDSSDEESDGEGDA